jgi:hypothetical protein
VASFWPRAVMCTWKAGCRPANGRIEKGTSEPRWKSWPT